MTVLQLLHSYHIIPSVPNRDPSNSIRLIPIIFILCHNLAQLAKLGIFPWLFYSNQMIITLLSLSLSPSLILFTLICTYLSIKTESFVHSVCENPEDHHCIFVRNPFTIADHPLQAVTTRGSSFKLFLG